MYIADYNIRNHQLRYEIGHPITDPNYLGRDYYRQLHDALDASTRGDFQLNPKDFRHRSRFAKFFAEKAGTQCGSDTLNKKVTQPTLQSGEYCGGVQVNQFTSILRVTAGAEERNRPVNLTITSPSGMQVTAYPVKVHNLNAVSVSDATIESGVTLFSTGMIFLLNVNRMINIIYTFRMCFLVQSILSMSLACMDIKLL